jgi:anti-sigma regulatory factor (Ser/Thr protein kinase)
MSHHGQHGACCQLPIDMKSLRAFREFVEAQAVCAGLQEQAAGLLVVAGAEVFTNIVRHAKGLPKLATVDLITHNTAYELVLEVIYHGEEFIPPNQLTETDFGAFPEGGFGLNIIYLACDKVEFLHHNGVNTVRLSCAKET